MFVWKSQDKIESSWFCLDIYKVYGFAWKSKETLGFCCLYENIKMKQKIWGFCLFINLKINSEAKNELSPAISCLVWARPRYLCQLKGIATSRVNKVDKKMGKSMIYFTMWHGFRFDYIHQKWRRKLWRLLFWEHIWKRISECQVFPRQISETFHGICLPILHLPPY